MSKIEATIDGIAKSGTRYSYALGIPASAADELSVGNSITVQGVKVEVVGNDGEHLAFEVQLAQLAGSPLADVDVGDTVTVEG